MLMRLVGLILVAALCPAQHVQFGSLVASPVANMAADSAGNLYLLTETLAFAGFGTPPRRVTLVMRYGRDGSERVVLDTELAAQEGWRASFLAVDPQDRIYVVSNRESETVLARFSQENTGEPTPRSLPMDRVVGIAFAPNGDTVVLGANDAGLPSVSRLDAASLNQVAHRSLTGGGSARALAVDSEGAVYIAGSAAARGFQATPGALQQGCEDCNWGAVFVTKLSADLQSVVYSTLIGDRGVSGATAIQVASDGSAYVAGYIVGGAGESPFPTTPGAFQRQLHREPELWTTGGGLPFVVGPSTGFVSRLNADGAGLIASTLLGGSLSEAIDGLALDEQGRVIVHGAAQSRDFPATGVFETRCGPDRGRAFDARFLTRLDPLLERVEKSIAIAGVDSRGLPAGPVRHSVMLVLGSSLAIADFDRDDDSDVACLVSGASYKGLSEITPGQLMTIFGRGLGPDTLAAFETGEPLPTVVDGTEVFFDGAPAPILAAQDSQLNVVAPFQLKGRVWMEIQRNGERIYLRHLGPSVHDADPMIWVGADGAAIPSPESPHVLLAVAANEDGSLNSAENPAAAGSMVSVFTSGLGALDSPLPETGYGDGVARPERRFLVRTAAEQIEEVESVTLPGRTVAVAAVRFRVPAGARGPLHFSMEPPPASGVFSPLAFIYVSE